MQSVPFFRSSYNGSYNGSYTAPTPLLQLLQKSHVRVRCCESSTFLSHATLARTHTKISVQHLRTGVRPERKKRPLHSRRAAPPHPRSMQCWLSAELNWGQVSRCEKIVPFLFEDSIPKPPTLQGVGPAGHSQGMCWEAAEGTLFSLGTGRYSILNTQA